jgi:hypothetical protein
MRATDPQPSCSAKMRQGELACIYCGGSTTTLQCLEAAAALVMADPLLCSSIGVFDDAAPGGPIEVLEVRGESFEKILSSRRSRSPLATKRRTDEALDSQQAD